MTVLKIYNLDDEAEVEAICTLTEGEHHIGRGDILRCKDKRVPRDHLVINVNKEGASIKSVHANPYFYRPQGGNIQMLKLNMTSALNNDDQFALLAYKFWFKVKVLKEPPDKLNNNDNVEEEDVPGSPAKRKIENESTPKPKRQKNDVLDLTVENLESSDEQLKGSYFTTNTTRTVRRDRCWYGVACYKRNPIHQQYFSHPGDNDYASDPEEDRLMCPFGAGCYSIDMNHRRQYMHARPLAPKPTTSTTSAPATKDDESVKGQSTPPQKKRQKKRQKKQKREAPQKKKYWNLFDDYIKFMRNRLPQSAIRMMTSKMKTAG